LQFVSLAVLSSILTALHVAQKQLASGGAPILKELADQARVLLPDPQILLALNTVIEKGEPGRTSSKSGLTGREEGGEGSKGLEEGLVEEEGEEGVSTEELHLQLLEVLAGYQASFCSRIFCCLLLYLIAISVPRCLECVWMRSLVACRFEIAAMNVSNLWDECSFRNRFLRVSPAQILYTG
jgi:hypothetical protein